VDKMILSYSFAKELMMKSRLRLEARRLREEGKSVKEIQTMLGVSKASVSVWVRDIELTEAQKLALKDRQHRSQGQMKGAQVNRERGIIRRTAYQEAGRAKAREMRPLHT
jgi:predicted transcriptional regulator